MKKLLALFLALIALLSLAPASYADAPTVDTAEIALLYCFHTSSTLYEKNAEQKIAPGNTAQLMTALLVIEAFPDLDKTVTLSGDFLPGWYAPDDYRTLADYGFHKGASVKIRDLLAAMVIENANCAALLLSAIVSGDKITFAEKMTERAAALGMTNTVYKSPAGYDTEGAYTTANDLLLLAKALYETPAFMSLASLASYPMESSGSRIYTRNYMLGKWYTSEYLYANANGMKAGYTDGSGNTLVATSTEDNGYSYLAIVLGGEDRNFKNTSYAIAKDLFKWGSTSFTLREVLSNANRVTTLPVNEGDRAESVNVFPKEPINAFLEKSVALSDLTVSYTLTHESLDAPFEQNTVVGEISVSYNGKLLGKTELITANGIRRAQNANLKNRLFAMIKPTLAILATVFLIICIRIYQKRRSSEE